MTMTKSTKKSKITRAIAGILMSAALVTAPAAAWASNTTVHTVAPESTQSWTVFVSAGWHHVITVGDLDLYVYDCFGNLLGIDDDSTDTCIVEFYVPFGQYIRINVQNLGDVYNQYVLDI